MMISIPFKSIAVIALAIGVLLGALPTFDLMFDTQVLFGRAAATTVVAAQHKAYLRDPEGGGRERLVLYGTISYGVEGVSQQVDFQITEDYWSSGGQYEEIKAAVLERKAFSVWYLRPLPRYVLFTKTQIFKWDLLLAVCVPVLVALLAGAAQLKRKPSAS